MMVTNMKHSLRSIFPVAVIFYYELYLKPEGNDTN